MSLYDFIYNLQKKPLNYRRRVLILVLIISFGCLTALWITSFKNQIHSRASNETGSGISGSEAEGMLSPAAALIGGFKNLASDITAKIKEYSDTVGGVGDTRVRPLYELPRNQKLESGM